MLLRGNYYPVNFADFCKELPEHPSSKNNNLQEPSKGPSEWGTFKIYFNVWYVTQGIHWLILQIWHKTKPTDVVAQLHRRWPQVLTSYCAGKPSCLSAGRRPASCVSASMRGWLMILFPVSQAPLLIDTTLAMLLISQALRLMISRAVSSALELLNLVVVQCFVSLQSEHWHDRQEAPDPAL